MHLTQGCVLTELVLSSPPLRNSLCDLREKSGALPWEPWKAGPRRGTQVHPSVRTTVGDTAYQRRRYLAKITEAGSQDAGPLYCPLASSDWGQADSSPPFLPSSPNQAHGAPMSAGFHLPNVYRKSYHVPDTVLLCSAPRDRQQRNRDQAL